MWYTPQKMRLGLCFPKIINRTLAKVMCRFATQKMFRKSFFVFFTHFWSKVTLKVTAKTCFVKHPEAITFFVSVIPISYTPQKMQLGLFFQKNINRTLKNTMCRFGIQKSHR